MKPHLQNGKERKPTYNYFCKNEANSKMSGIRNGRKKAEITSYSDTSPAMAPKSDEHQYCSILAATPGATNFTLLTRGSYKLGGDSVVYTSRCDGTTLCHC